jgi:hypothetical protein
MLLILTTATLVFLRAFQQQNVMGGHYLSAALTSYAIAFAEVAVIVGIVTAGWSAVVWVGTGGAIGVTTAMLAHGFIFNRRETK